MEKEKTIRWVKCYNCGYTYHIIAFFSSETMQEVYKDSRCPYCNSNLIKEEKKRGEKEHVEI